MTSWPLDRDPMQYDASSNDLLQAPKPAVATVLPPDVWNVDQLDFNEIDKIAFSQKKIKIPRLRWSHVIYSKTDGEHLRYLLQTKSGPHVLPPSQMAPWHPARPQHASQICLERSCLYYRKLMLFIGLGKLRLHVHSGVVDNLALLVVVQTLFKYRFSKRIFPMEWCIVLIRSHAVAMIPE